MDFPFQTNVPYYAKGDNTAYYCRQRDAYILDNYKAKNLPLVGWIKYCTGCSTITRSKVVFPYRNENIIIPICHHCKKKKSRNKLYLHCIQVIRNIYFH